MKSRYDFLVYCLVSLATFSSYSQTNSATPVTYIPFPTALGSPVSIVLHPEAPGLTIPKTFQGISIRTITFTNPKYLTTENTQLLNLIKNLGDGGCFRFGGGGVVW